MTEPHATAECTALWCPDCTQALDTMVGQMTMLYAHARNLPGRSLLSVHVDEANDIFTLRIGVGRDAAAWLALHEWLTPGASDRPMS